MGVKFRTSLSRALGLGSAKEGAEHWWIQRATAVGLVFLGPWFVYFCLSLIGMPHRDVLEYLSNPITATFLILFVFSSFYHAKLGMEVVIEDYVHNEFVKYTSLILIKFMIFGVGILSLFLILKIAIH
jgi:succinate dehydrogenase / fumarate reductase membrane anchor subunit